MPSTYGIVIALFSSIGYISSGTAHFALEDGFGVCLSTCLVGYCLPSRFTAFRAKAIILTVPTIKKIFAVLLLVMAANVIIRYLMVVE